MLNNHEVNLTDEEAAAEVARVAKTYPVVRLLSADQIKSEPNCLLAGDRCPCLRQSSLEALADSDEVSEQLLNDGTEYRARLRPLKVEGEPHVLLMVRPIERMVTNFLEILAHTRENGIEHHRRKHPAEFITDTRQLIIMCIEYGEIIRILLTEACNALIKRPSLRLRHCERDTNARLNKFDSAMEELRRCNGFGAQPLGLLEHTHGKKSEAKRS